jgi:hypothetical protein
VERHFEAFSRLPEREMAALWFQLYEAPSFRHDAWEHRNVLRAGDLARTDDRSTQSRLRGRTLLRRTEDGTLHLALEGQGYRGNGRILLVPRTLGCTVVLDAAVEATGMRRLFPERDESVATRVLDDVGAHFAWALASSSLERRSMPPAVP